MHEPDPRLLLATAAEAKLPHQANDRLGTVFVRMVLLVDMDVNLLFAACREQQDSAAMFDEADMIRIPRPVVPLRQRPQEMGRLQGLLHKRPAARLVVAEAERGIGADTKVDAAREPCAD